MLVWQWMGLAEMQKGKYRAGLIEEWRFEASDKFDAFGAELYEQLLLMTSGEAKEIVKGSEQENGFVAWKRLLDRYDSKTQARFLRDLMGALQPGRAKDFR